MSYHFINAVFQILTGKQSCLYVANLDEVAEPEQINFRDLIRTAFLNQGVEIEFSGKGLTERGAVIDIDEEKLTSLNLDINTLRFGQTVVRVKV